MIEKWEEMTRFQEKHLKRSLSGEPMATRIPLASDYCNALFMEVAELQDSFSWKPWRDSDSYDKDNIKREIVDCLFFLHHIAACFDITPDDLRSKYLWVMDNNKKRYHEGDFSDEEESETPTLETINQMLQQLLNEKDK